MKKDYFKVMGLDIHSKIKISINLDAIKRVKNMVTFTKNKMENSNFINTKRIKYNLIYLLTFKF